MGSTLEMSVLMRDNHDLNMVETLANVMMSALIWSTFRKALSNNFTSYLENLPRLYSFGT